MRPVIILMIFLSLLSCSKQTSDDHAEHAHATESATKYTCPMHPQVIQDAPGTCPICGMDLVPVNKTNTESNDLMLSDSQIKLANITTQRVSLQPVGQTVVINGKLTENENLTEVISSRAAGRIEKLSVKETGRLVKKGQPLYQLYSEVLLTLQQEFLLALEQYETLGANEKRYETFYTAARRKLLLYGLSEKQVDELAKSKKTSTVITFLSPVSGIVSELNVNEGQYIAEGAMLMKIDDTSKLWVEADLYPNETTLANIGDQISVRISGYENKSLTATVSFLSPEFRANTQITVMRAAINNADMLLQPGMQAQVFFTHSSHKALTVPIDAVIRDGNGAHVYLQKGHNTFRPQMVKTGIEDFEKVEILSGINEGDTVAVTGAYLLYSEIILKKGTDPMAGHNH